jgi:hypothetical protein
MPMNTNGPVLNINEYSTSRHISRVKREAGLQERNIETRDSYRGHWTIESECSSSGGDYIPPAGAVEILHHLVCLGIGMYELHPNAIQMSAIDRRSCTGFSSPDKHSHR